MCITHPRERFRAEYIIATPGSYSGQFQTDSGSACGRLADTGLMVVYNLAALFLLATGNLTTLSVDVVLPLDCKQVTLPFAPS